MGGVWDEVSAAVAASPYQVSLLPPDGKRAGECLVGLSLTTGSWLGALVVNAGGLLVDHGWLRVLGSGTDALPDVLAGADLVSAALPVAYDILGGQFVWRPGDEGRPTVHYFGPDDLGWSDLEVGYAGWLQAMLAGSMDEFYQHLRWPGWQAEVAAIGLDQGMHTWPPPWTAEGKDLDRVSRKALPMTELISLLQNAARQLDRGL